MSAMYKVILSGCLEFGTERSLEQVIKFFEHRAENYYRNDVLFRSDEYFDTTQYTLNIPRLITECSERRWRNTLNLLEFVAQYAIAGDLRAWVILEGKLEVEKIIEPKGDKSAVQAYIEGRTLIHQAGMEEEAMDALSRAIEKFERHALAYERRGHVNFKLRNYDDALYDFSKSIDINPNHPDAYWGRAKVHMVKKDYAAAVADLEKAISTSIPHQPIFWSARRLKGEAHYLLGDYDKALFELKLVAKRKFQPNDPNYKWQGRALLFYGKTLMEKGNYAEAIDAFNKLLALEIPEELAPQRAEVLYLRALARKKAGEGSYLGDLKEAATLGSEEASALLAEMK